MTKAWAGYFRDLKREGVRKAMPRIKFERKGRCRDKLWVSNAQFAIGGKRIRLPHVGWVGLTSA